MGHKWAVWGLFWANFAVVGGMKFPVCVGRCFGQPGDMAQSKCDMGCTRAFVGAAPNFFALQVTKELPVARRVGLSLTGLWRLAIWRVVLGLYLIAIEM